MTALPIGEVQIVEGDISATLEGAALRGGVVGCDIETTGLDWLQASIATVQVYVPGVGVEIVRIGAKRPSRLVELMRSPKVRKVFHHAAFDLRFMRHHWGVRAEAVNCTKVLAKIVHPGRENGEYSLKQLLQESLNVAIDKSMQVSDWTAPELTLEQRQYAVRDVLYLVDLRDVLLDDARRLGLADIVDDSFRYIPTRVETDIRGCGDVFAY